MTVQAHTADRRLVVLAVLGVVLALTAAMWTLAGCAPKAEPSAPAASEQKDGNGGSSAMDGQPVNWTMDSDCSMCHTVEAASAPVSVFTMMQDTQEKGSLSSQRPAR